MIPPPVNKCIGNCYLPCKETNVITMSPNSFTQHRPRLNTFESKDIVLYILLY